jgi:hypothetical protein
MSDPEKDTQRTEKGHEIPIPKRGDFFRNLRKVLKPEPDSLRDADRSAEERPEQS